MLRFSLVVHWKLPTNHYHCCWLTDPVLKNKNNISLYNKNIRDDDDDDDDDGNNNNKNSDWLWAGMPRLDSQNRQFSVCQTLRNHFWGPSNLLFSGQLGGFFSLKWIGRSVKLTIHLHLMPRLRMSGAIPPITCISS